MFLWRIHRALIMGREDELATAIKTINPADTLQLVEGPVRTIAAPVPQENAESGALALTTLQDARYLIANRWGEQRRVYFHPSRFDVSFWLPRLGNSIPVLNRRSLFTPVGALEHQPVPLDALLTEGALFVRPDSGLKPFTGFVLSKKDGGLKSWHDVALELAANVRHLEPERMVSIARARRLEATEWRFWIVGRTVVANASYSWEQEDVPWAPLPLEALQVAQAMAANSWQPDIAYVVDVVRESSKDMAPGGPIGNNGYFLNELNAASTSGLYNAPFSPLLTALREAVLGEVAGDLSVEV